MKKNFLFVLLGIVAVLTSCNKEEVGGLATNKATSFNVSVDGGVQTRFTLVTDLTRFVMEVYKGPVATGTLVKHIEQANGTFTEVLLNDQQEYTVLFWADYGTPGTAGTNNPANEYNATDLKAARVAEGKQPTQAAYSGVKTFTVGTDLEADYTNVVLTHSVAQVNFIQTEALTAAGNTLEVSYPESYSVNVGDNSVTKITGAITHTFSYKSTATGTLGTSYLIAAAESPITVFEITATLNSETQKKVSNVPFQRNYRTFIRGAYSSKYAANLTVTCDDIWEKPDNNVVFPKIGDFCYKNKTFSSIYNYDPQNPCIGIVFVVDDNGRTGKIVGLTEPDANWNGGTNAEGKLLVMQNDHTTNAQDPDNGVVNMETIKTIDPTLEGYPAFAWAESLNTPATVGINWYLPARDELQQLCAAINGKKWVVSGAGDGEFNGWNDGLYQFDDNAAFTAFNEKFNSIQEAKTPISNESYWSSTEKNIVNSTFFLSVHLFNGFTDIRISVPYRVRAISAF